MQNLIKITLSNGSEKHCPIYNINTFPYNKYYYTHGTDYKKGMAYVDTICAFDIETTTVTVGDRAHAFMYIWQACIGERVCMGRTWQEYITFVQRLNVAFGLDVGKRLVVYVHNLAYEFQFMRNYVNFTEVFAKDTREVLKCVANNIEYRCSYSLTNMGLGRFCEQSKTVTFNKKGNYDYRKMRTPNTQMLDSELEYCYCDVAGLVQGVKELQDHYNDTNATIPLTSTGYIRREARKRVLRNKYHKDVLNKTRLSLYQYGLCKTAVRGGNCHCNAIYSGRTIPDVISRDLVSAYPAVMLTRKYPVSRFVEIKGNYDKYMQGKACLIDCTLSNLQIKTLDIIPYIAKAKCTSVRGGRIDNGRVIEASSISMVTTDIDMAIIKELYTFDDIHYNSVHIADYGYLPREYRLYIIELFKQKDELKNGDPYLYMKIKNKINALFGMMLTDILHDEYIYTGGADAWGIELVDKEKALADYYKNHSSFLSYQHGIWVTAHTRRTLQEGLNIVRDDGIYTDTDSIKHTGEYTQEFNALNAKLMREAEEADVPAYIEVDGKRKYLGVWELDAEYELFKSLGAKKYAYIEKGSNIVKITVAGLSKKNGATYINNNGGLDIFDVGTVIPAGHSGRTIATYNDVDSLYYIDVKGERIQTGSNMAIVDGSYTFGMSDEYLKYIEYLNDKNISKDFEKLC